MRDDDNGFRNAGRNKNVRDVIVNLPEQKVHVIRRILRDPLARCGEVLVTKVLDQLYDVDIFLDLCYQFKVDLSNGCQLLKFVDRLAEVRELRLS